MQILDFRYNDKNNYFILTLEIKIYILQRDEKRLKIVAIK